MVTQSASADLDSPEYNELNRLNDMIDKRYSQGSHMTYINGRLTQIEQQINAMNASYAVYSNQSSKKKNTNESDNKNKEIQLPAVIGSPL